MCIVILVSVGVFDRHVSPATVVSITPASGSSDELASLGNAITIEFDYPIEACISTSMHVSSVNDHEPLLQTIERPDSTTMVVRLSRDLYGDETVSLVLRRIRDIDFRYLANDISLEFGNLR